MQAIGTEQRRIRAFAHRDQGHPQHQVDAGSRSGDGHAESEILNFHPEDDLADGFVKNQQGRGRYHGPFEACGKESHLVVTEVMRLIRRFVRKPQGPGRKTHGEEMHYRLSRVRVDRGRTGEHGCRDFRRQQHQCGHQREIHHAFLFLVAGHAGSLHRLPASGNFHLPGGMRSAA